MDSQELQNVCKYLRSKEIQLFSNNDWLINCINWYKSHLELGNIYGYLQEYVFIQWLLADLQDVQQRCLPPVSKDRNMELTGRYPVQINWMRDIGQSCYTQLKSTLNVNASESNDDVTTDEPRKQNWEPNPKRVLMIEITDGITTLKAMEYSPIAKLTDDYLPGLKVMLIGPIECRKGILFLTNSNISVLGGEVDYLSELNSKENLLSRCLKLRTNCDVVQERETNGSAVVPLQERETNGTVTSSCHAPNIIQTNRSQLFNDIVELPDSTSAIEDRDLLMSDEDDAFLRQLPLDCAENLEPETNELSPVLGESGHGSINEKSTFFKNNSVGTKKPRLFSPLKDLRSIEREITARNETKSVTFPLKTHEGLASTSCLSSPKKNSIKLQNHLLDQSFACSSIMDYSFSNNTLEKQTSVEQNHPGKIDLELRNDETAEHFSINEIQYPQFKKVEVKVESIVKLKIRNGEWFCCAHVFFEEKNWNVTFSNKVLETLFGISASEVEVWRGEMAKNPLLKKKVNDILKAGQTKLKILNCPMTIEYSSESCTPHVVILHI